MDRWISAVALVVGAVNLMWLHYRNGVSEGLALGPLAAAAPDQDAPEVRKARAVISKIMGEVDNG